LLLKQEAVMARLDVLAIPNIDVRNYDIAVHGRPLHNTSGTVEVDGECGDGSWQPLRYSVLGEAGAKFGLRISCGTALVYSKDIVISEGCESYESEPGLGFTI
jgi:hypothetical protein